jgi:hypothetical protein
MKDVQNWIKKKFILLLVLLSLCAIIYIQNSLAKNANLKINNAKIELVKYELKDGTQVASMARAELKVKELNKLIDEKNSSLKLLRNKFEKVNTFSESIQETKYDSIVIKYKDTIKIPFKVTGEVINKDYSFSYKSTEKDFVLKDFKIVDTVYRIEGMKRKWFLGKKTYTLDEVHSNKNVTVVGGKYYERKEDVKWYESKVAIFFLGFLTASTVNQIK